MSPTVSTPARSSDRLRYLVQREVLRHNLMIALVVGTLLTIINQLDVVLREGLTFRLTTKIAANFAIPFLVSSFSALINRHSHGGSSARISGPETTSFAKK